MNYVYRSLKAAIFTMLISVSFFAPASAAGSESIKNSEPGDILLNIRDLPFDHDYFTLRGDADNSRIKFAGTKSGRVAFLGGSITHNPGWREMVGDYLENQFPGTDFEFINAGIPSMGSTPGAFRIKRDVLSHGPVDLLFVEAAVNDSTNGRSGTEQVRGMEGIVRQAWQDNPETDIIFLYFADTEKTGLYDQGQVPDVIKNHEIVADYYGISSLNLALETAERIRSGQFEWDRDFKDVHPSPFGQQLYAQSIIRMLNQLWKDPNPKREVIIAKKLPDALLDENSYLNGRLADIRGAEIRKGWRITENWQPDDSAGTRPGFVSVPMLEASGPGAEMAFRFYGKGVGIFVAAGPDAGSIEYSIDGGEARTLDLFTRWSSGLHLPWAYMLAAELTDQAEEHCLTVKIAAEKNPDSTGHAVRIAHFLVN